MSGLGTGAARGVVAAMAMTAVRNVTAGFGLIERTPPERVAHEGVPGLLGKIPPQHRDESIEIAHWAFGATAGVGFRALPDRVKRQAWIGPAYGIALWAGFEVVLRRLFELSKPRRKPYERLAVAADHALYGIIVAARSGRPA